MEFKLIIDPSAPEEVTVRVHAPSELTAQLENLIRNWEGSDTVAAYDEDTLLRLDFSEIECVTVIDRKLHAIASDGGCYRLRLTLREAEQQLPSYFVRINKSTIANRRRIKRFKATFSGAVDAVFQSGHTDYVSRRCMAHLKKEVMQ